MTRRFWLSFCDDNAPDGEAFLGVAVIDVTDADATAMQAILDHQFPRHRPGSEWIAAATRKAHVLGCNPGGQVAAVELKGRQKKSTETLLNRLLSKAELLERGLV